MFGSVLDQLLEQTRQLVLVAKLGHPLNTTSRLVVLIPRGADHVPGFLEAVQSLKLLANRLGATIVGYTVDSPSELYNGHFVGVKPQAAVDFKKVSTWREVIERLPDELRADDLVIVLSSRRGSIPWTPVLERLPGRLATLVPESFIMLYPSEVVPERSMGFGESVLPGALAPTRILVDLPETDFEAALRALLVAQFPDQPDRVESYLEELVRNASAFVPEIKPGVIVPHGRVPDLEQGIIFLGTSRAGIPFPGGEDQEPARLLFVVLTGESGPQEHLNHLAEIAVLVSDPARERRLLDATTVDEVMAVGLPETRVGVS